MTLYRDGWLDGRPLSVLRDESGGEAKYVCLDCGAELEADAAVFEKHLCENFRDGPTLTITPAAEKLASEEGLDPEDVDGTGKDGRITKADVEAATEE